MNTKPAFLSEYQCQMLSAMGVDLLVFNDPSDTSTATDAPATVPGIKTDLASIREKVGIAETATTSSDKTNPEEISSQPKTSQSNSESQAPQLSSLDGAVVLLFKPVSRLEKDVVSALELSGVTVKALPDFTPGEISMKFSDVALVLCHKEVAEQSSDNPMLQIRDNLSDTDKKQLWRTIQSLAH